MSYHEQPRASLSRRSVILKGAGLAAAGVVVGAAVPYAVAELSDSSTEAGQPVAPPPLPVMVHLRDAGSGDFDVFVGNRLVAVNDRAFAARLSEIANA